MAHFKFADPLSKNALSRSSRSRHLKRRCVDHTDAVEKVVDGAGGILDDQMEMQVVEETEGSVSKAEGTEEFDLTEGTEKFDLAEGTEKSDLAEGTDTTKRQVENIDGLTELLPEEPAFDAESSDEAIADLDEAGHELDEASQSESNTESPESPKKVFVDCPLTESASNLLVLQYSIRHSLSQEAVADLLKLLQIHCPTPNTVPSSLYLFRKQFPSLQNMATSHYFCSFCLQEVSGKELSSCPNFACGKSLQTFQALSSFFELSIEQQITNLLERK